MVDDAIIFGIFDAYQHLLRDGEHMLIDGFLRTLQQMHYYFFQEYKHKRDFIGIHYVFSKEKALERILLRAQKE
jgi:adenylate kinase family enzyme